MKSPFRSVRSAFAVLCLFSATAAAAIPGWLIATPGESVRAGELLEVEVVRPDATAPWPETLRLRLQRADGSEEILVLQGTAASAELRRTYAAQLPRLPAGVLRTGLDGQQSNRLALFVQAAPRHDAIDRMSSPSEEKAPKAPPTGIGPDTLAEPAPRLDPLPDDEPALAANEPMYFVVGARDGANARFQLSFKYRLFDERSLPARLAPVLGHLHFGYTQTSLWDLHGDSKPFRDTSYRPSLFWQGRVGDGNGGAPAFLRGGYEHESNGKDGEKSRSIDTLFVQPAWRKDFADGRTLLFAPKFFAYLDRENNEDIAHYRGYADWLLRYGNENGWVASTRLRRGSSGHGSAQFDLSHPLRDPLFSRVGGFLHFQIFSGYGETLLDYNVKRDPQLRIGFSIVR